MWQQTVQRRLSWLRQGGRVLHMIRVGHTVFALPFAYLGVLWGGREQGGELPAWFVFAWVTLAMLGARSAAMACNRLVDHEFDAANPRTCRRELPAGRLSRRFVGGFLCVMLLLFLGSTWGLPPLARQLSPLAILCLLGYSYTKRFTWGCHFVLGATLGLAPLGGWIAATGSLTWIAAGLAGLVLLWVAGFDILYACADVDFDRTHGLHAIPARFGVKRAVTLATWCHGFTVLGLVTVPLWGKGRVMWGSGWLLSWLVACALLFFVHGWVRKAPLPRWAQVVFPCNGAVSIILLLGLGWDIWSKGE